MAITEVKLRYGNVAFLKGDKLVSRSCRTCKEVKDIDSFCKHKTGYAGYATQCRSCVSQRRKDTWSDRKAYNDKWRSENRDKFLAGNKVYYEKTKEGGAERKRKWRQENPEADKAQQQRRRARKVGLPNDLTAEQTESIVKKFGGCALTGDSSYHLDHVISLSLEVEGTTLSNMLPLRGDLNSSKCNKNIFEWFESVRDREGLSQEKFDDAIRHLAALKGMTADGYRKYVYECHKEGNE
ncbi:MAG: hypothetical protein LC650_05450 [Actinobacteria bacterium]|nr:hypothetical protein [Actinomycetota bacterium]